MRRRGVRELRLAALRALAWQLAAQKKSSRGAELGSERQLQLCAYFRLCAPTCVCAARRHSAQSEPSHHEKASLPGTDGLQPASFNKSFRPRQVSPSVKVTWNDTDGLA